MSFFLCITWKRKWKSLSLILCDPMEYTIHGIFQARILEWVAFPFAGGSSQPRDWTQVQILYQLSHKGSPLYCWSLYKWEAIYKMSSTILGKWQIVHIWSLFVSFSTPSSKTNYESRKAESLHESLVTQSCDPVDKLSLTFVALPFNRNQCKLPEPLVFTKFL